MIDYYACIKECKNEIILIVGNIETRNYTKYYFSKDNISAKDLCKSLCHESILKHIDHLKVSCIKKKQVELKHYQNHPYKSYKDDKRCSISSAIYQCLK